MQQSIVKAGPHGSSGPRSTVYTNPVFSLTQYPLTKENKKWRLKAQNRNAGQELIIT